MLILMKQIFIAATVLIFALGTYFLYRAETDRTFEVANPNPSCEEKVVVYMSPYCRYCTSAKELLDGIKMPYQSIDVSNDRGKRAELADKTGRATVPQIYINDQHIGGYDDLKALQDNGKLARFRQTCNVDDLK